tara:strand:- start:353 stop:517 length:165 start_codon:yes stop_codon:yes gene_type:complete
MMYLDGTPVDAKVAVAILDGRIETTRMGYCSETKYMVLDAGDFAIIVHSVFIEL